MRTLLIVLLVVAAVLLLISCIRVGGIAEYAEEGVLAKVRIGPVKIQLYPRKKPQKDSSGGDAAKEKRKKHKKKKKPKGDSPSEKKTQETQPKRGGRLEFLRTWLPLGIEALGDLKRNIRIDELFLDYTINGRSDPAKAAILYGRLCAGGGAIAALLENNFDIRSRHFSARVDFMAEHALVYARLSMSFTIGQLVHIVLSLAWKAFGIWRVQRPNRKQEVTQDGKQEPDQ